MTHPFGYQDASFQAAGGWQGLTKLVNRFYDLMDQQEQFQTIRHMHPADLTVSRDKLIRFLALWTGGPKTYADKYGPISIPKAHRHLPIRVAERDAWIECMRLALADQDYSDAFKDYLITQLQIPAERVRVSCEQAQQASP